MCNPCSRKIDKQLSVNAKSKRKICGKVTCGPCALCQSKGISKWQHLGTMTKKGMSDYIAEKYFSKHNITLQIDACICNACYRKHEKLLSLGRPMQTPEKKAKEKPKCFLVQLGLCNSTSDVFKPDVTSEDICFCFDIKLCDVNAQVHLCKDHDNKFRNYLKSINCSACNCSLRNCKLYKVSAMSIAPSVVNARLQFRNTNFEDVGINGVLCGACYVAANRQILTIEEILLEIEQDTQYLNADQSSVSSAMNTVVRKALLEIYKHICTLCKNNEAFLLIDIYELYLHNVNQHSNCLSDQDKLYCQKSAKWLEGMIASKFGNLLEFHRLPSSKRSVLILYVNLDLKKALHVAMSKSRLTQKKFDASNSTCSDENDDDVFYPETLGTMMHSTFLQLNDILRDQAKRVREYFTRFPLRVSEIDFDEMLRLVDPRVWNTMCILTMNTSERKHFDSSSFVWDKEYLKFPNKDKLKGQIQFNRRLINIFGLHFIMNDANNYPFQLINSVIIKQFSNSSQLLQIFNRQGFAVSDDVLQCFLTTVQKQKEQPSARLGVNNDAFTIVTVDNIDVLSPYATVKQGVDRSWHGTSIMQQQPRPSEKLSNTRELLPLDHDLENNEILVGSVNHANDIAKGFEHHNDSELVVNNGASTRSKQSTPSNLYNASPPKKKAKVILKKPSARRSLSNALSNVSFDSDSFEIPLYKTFLRDQLKFSFFTASDFETELVSKLKFDMLVYFLERYVSVEQKTTAIIPGLKCTFALHSDLTCEQSSYSYMCVLDEKADSPETLEHVMAKIYVEYDIGKSRNHIVVGGDGLTIDYIMKLKSKYKDYWGWVIPYLGDWHVLKNYQEVLLKIFWDAGLKQVANVLCKTMLKCQNWKRNHRFLLQVYEAIYLYQIKCFLEYRSGKIVSDNDFTNDVIVAKVTEVVNTMSNAKYVDDVEEFLTKENDILSLVSAFKEEFDLYRKSMSEQFPTFRFWDNFLQGDCLAYIQLWVAVRKGDWFLRMAALKLMVPLFNAFDRQNYSKLIPLHLSQMYGLPNHILDHFVNGAWVTSIKGAAFSSVGCDECHEMTINKSCKMALSHGIPKDMDRLSKTLQYQADSISNFKLQLKIQVQTPLQRDLSPSVVKEEFSNVCLYYEKISQAQLFSTSQPNHLFQLFTNTAATSAQIKGLMCCREIGQDAYVSYVKGIILKDASIAKPVLRKNRLKTFTKEKQGNRKINYLQKEKKLVSLCLKRAMAYSEKTKKPIGELCQFLDTPRAICNSEGLAVKTEKYNMYTFFKNRYDLESSESIDPALNTMQPVRDVYKFNGPETCIIIEGMNIIHSNPQSLTKTFHHYAQMIFDIWVIHYFDKGYKDVRILFDMSKTQGLSPKCFERDRRDKTEKDVDHLVFDVITDDTLLPSPLEWQEFLQIRGNKSKLLNYLSESFVSLASKILTSREQKFVTSGGFLERGNFTGVSVTSDGVTGHEIIHNHEESDTQIWLHAKDTTCKAVHIYSLDRDIGVIGLPLIKQMDSKVVVVQFKRSPAKYLILNDLNTALSCDPELNFLLERGVDLGKLMQVIYIVSGCDFVSYWVRQSKTTFFKLFFQYAKFIAGTEVDDHLAGCLTQTELPQTWEAGLLAFFRFIGVVYFASNRACLHEYTSPSDLFDSIDAENVLDHHHEFLNIIRKATWKGEFEDTLLPSNTALEYHWKRSCWVSTVWGMALTPVFNYPDISLYGWKVKSNGIISIEWDSEENMQAARENVRFYTRGCGCPTSRCLRGNCRCRKNGKRCGPGCTCKNCENQEDCEPQIANNPAAVQVPRDPGNIKCGCTTSKCKTGNCKCRKNGKRCNQSCRCQNCENQEQVEVLQLSLAPVATENTMPNVFEILESQSMGLHDAHAPIENDHDAQEGQFEISYSDLEDSDLSDASNYEDYAYAREHNDDYVTYDYDDEGELIAGEDFSF